MLLLRPNWKVWQRYHQVAWCLSRRFERGIRRETKGFEAIAKRSTEIFCLLKFWILACQWHLRPSHNHHTSRHDSFLFYFSFYITRGCFVHLRFLSFQNAVLSKERKPQCEDESNKSGSSAEHSAVRKLIISWDMYSIIVQVLRISVSFNFNESFRVITLSFCSLESTSKRLITFEMTEQRRNYFGPESSGPHWQRYPDWLKNGKSYRGRSAKYGHS